MTVPASEQQFWNQRYDREDFVFGEAPNAFLVRESHRLRPGMRALAVADGEGRNGVWLAEQGLDVLSVDFSPVAQDKARQLAARRGVSPAFEQVDLLAWQWPRAAFDVVAAIFVQFVGPAARERLFAGMLGALKPGGLLLLQGYTPEQLHYGTGGPGQVENLYTPEMLRAAFADQEILRLDARTVTLSEGAGHNGLSAVIDCVVRKRA